MRRGSFVLAATLGLARAGGASARAADPLEEPSRPFTGPRSQTLALGKIESLPPDTDLAATIVRCSRSASESTTERHFSTIQYVLEGEPTLTLGDGYRVTMRPGDAMWIAPIETHTHGAATSDSVKLLSFAMHPAGESSAPDPSCETIFRSARIPQPPVQRYYESLVSITLPPFYATAPVTIDALQTFYVLSGRAGIRIDSAEPRALGPGEATYVAPLQRYDWSTAGEGATVLVYSVFGESPVPRN